MPNIDQLIKIKSHFYTTSNWLGNLPENKTCFTITTANSEIPRNQLILKSTTEILKNGEKCNALLKDLKEDLTK